MSKDIRLSQYEFELEMIDRHLFDEFNIEATRSFCTEDTIEAKRLLRICDMLKENTRLREALEYVQKHIEDDLDHWWIDCPDKGGFDTDRIEQALKGE